MFKSLSQGSVSARVRWTRLGSRTERAWIGVPSSLDPLEPYTLPPTGLSVFEKPGETVGRHLTAPQAAGLAIVPLLRIQPPLLFYSRGVT